MQLLSVVITVGTNTKPPKNLKGKSGELGIHKGIHKGASLVAHTVKESSCYAGVLASIPWSGRSPGEGHGNPLQYSCLEHPMDRGAWRVIVHGVAKSLTRLSDFTHSWLVAQSCPTLSDSMDYNPPGSSVHGILQARILEWVAISLNGAQAF